MIFNIEVNNKPMQARKGETILSALRRNGVDVPTLCHMQGLTATGACRICVVEVEGRSSLLPSCSAPVEEWMKIYTHSPRVIQARKTLIELLLANHPDDCLFCPRNGNCELQRLAATLNIRERRFHGKKSTARIDQSCPAITRDPSKCILCGRCVRMCDEIIGVSTLDFTGRGLNTGIGTCMNKAINVSSCITCGQCTLVCPTAALREKDQVSEVQQLLHKEGVYPVAIYSPAMSVSIAEAFGQKAGKDLQGMLNGLLKKIGFKKVFDTTFAADILVNELVEILHTKSKEATPLPLVSSCCPAWVKYAEQFLPEYLHLLAPLLSPQQIMAKLVKNQLAAKNGINAGQVVLCSITPCTARKFEAQREELHEQGTPWVDQVITTRELLRLVQLNGIDIQQIDEERSDAPYDIRSSAGKLTASSGGLAEAVSRGLYYRLQGEEMPTLKVARLRGSKEKKEYALAAGGKVQLIAATSSLEQARVYIEDSLSGKKSLLFLEVMACPGGCVNGGGQASGAAGSLAQRVKTLQEIDEKDPVRCAHKNPLLIELYRSQLKAPGSQACTALFGTSFKEKTVLL